MVRRSIRPRDPNQRAKLIVDIATGQTEDQFKKLADVRGRAGGIKGGKARAKRLTPEQRQEIARVAAQARWKK